MADLRQRIMTAAGLTDDIHPPPPGTRATPRTRQASTTPSGPAEAGTTARSTTPTTSPQPNSAVTAVVDPAVADHDRGRHDGTRAAESIPLYALEGLVVAQFHLEQWLQPWRERWRLIATGQAPPDPNLSRWLPALADLLGSTAAAPELPQARHNPSDAYRHGFARGMAETWGRAVNAGRVPAIPPALAAWLREPRPANERPRSLLTLAELDRSAARARKRRVWTITGRTTLWILVGLFVILEIVAIGVTVTNGWPQHNVTGAVTGNLCYGLPLLGLVTLGLIDLRRLRRRRRSVEPAPTASVHPPDQKDH
jgi:hypothetical protein